MRLPPVGAAPTAQAPGVAPTGAAPAAQPSFSLPYKPKLFLGGGEKGIHPEFTKPGDAASMGAPTQEQIDAVTRDPSLLGRFDPVAQSVMKPIVDQHSANVERITKRVAGSAPLTNYIGAGEKPGLKQVASQLDGLVNEYKNPQTGAIDWTKVTPAEAFSIIFAEGKVNDPNAVIRQQEFENIARQSGLKDTASNIYRKVMDGQLFAPRLMQNIYNAVHKKVESARQSAFSDFRNIAKEAGEKHVPLEHVINDPDVINEFNQWQQGQGQLPNTGGPSVTRPGTASSPSAGPTRIASQDEFNKLPPGATFEFNGRVGTKK